MSTSFSSITVDELAQKLASDIPSLQLVDVREPDEVAIAEITGFQNFPLSQASEWSQDLTSRLDPSSETLVLCHHGMRSAQMCQWLVNQGFTQVTNISGGIDAYSQVVDRSIPRY